MQNMPQAVREAPRQAHVEEKHERSESIECRQGEVEPEESSWTQYHEERAVWKQVHPLIARLVPQTL